MEVKREQINVLKTEAHEKIEAIVHHKHEKNEAIEKMGLMRDHAEKMEREKLEIFEEHEKIKWQHETLKQTNVRLDKIVE